MQITWRLEKLLVTFVFIVIAAYGYFYANELNHTLKKTGDSSVNIKTRWDDWIPFIPEFVYPYYIYYPFMLLVVPISRTRIQFYHVVTAFAILEASAILTFILFPTKVIRPEIIPTDITTILIHNIFSLDLGYNLLPSLHVGHSVLVSVFFYVYYRKYFIPVFMVAISICLSTVFIKQHYVIDIPFGIIYALSAYNLAKYLIYKNKSIFAVENGKNW